MTMNEQEILRKFNELADTAPDEATRVLLRELGELFYARLVHTSSAYAGIRSDFQELSTLVLTRLQDNERVHAERLEGLINRSHNLSNRFMAVENKVDELAALVIQYFDNDPRSGAD